VADLAGALTGPKGIPKASTAMPKVSAAECSRLLGIASPPKQDSS
jgi:hypothetical protein